jgi:anti-sigma regulatory factor (Ser/Thr protein kinase)
MFYSETLPKSPTAPAAARDLLERLHDRLAPDRLDDARLLTSELVANAVEHVVEEGDIEVRVELSDGELRVDVLDPGPGFTYVPRAEAAGDSDRGWGLVFTERVATSWGNEPGRVWFVLSCT